jgi:hypothetical protein
VKTILETDILIEWCPVLAIWESGHEIMQNLSVCEWGGTIFYVDSYFINCWTQKWKK